jgi:hypothetical protein
MSRVTIKTGLVGPDGREEELTEYMCDYPDCPNIATCVLGCHQEHQSDGCGLRLTCGEGAGLALGRLFARVVLGGYDWASLPTLPFFREGCFSKDLCHR